MYIRREAEQTLNHLLGQGKVVLVTGARQVGKTTLLKHCLSDRYNYITMEDPIARQQADQDALLFFRSNELPLVIDEIQKAPHLFSAVKYMVDQSDEKGMVVLTGSQTYHLMKGMSESLAGRIRIMQMSGLSLREMLCSRALQGRLEDATGEPVAPRAYVPGEIKPSGAAFPPENIWHIIHRGSMPELQDPAIDWDSFYTDYVSAYLERDVRDLINIQDERRFYAFMVACAARTGQLFNASDIARVVGVDHKTVQSWVSVLAASGIIHIISPFWANVEKRLSKSPKLYFADTGLACHLTRWTSADTLERGAAAGHMFETFAVGEVLKSHMNAGENLRDIWFYRDARKHEIDLVIQRGHVLHPVEVKMAATVGTDAIKNFSYLEDLTGYEVGFGHVLCQTDRPYYLTDRTQAVPIWTI